MYHWHLITDPDHFGENEIICKASVQEGSHWFFGHFPGDPILPGIAQLAMVFDAIQKVHKNSRKISEIRRVRFKQVIRPADIMELTITSSVESSDHYSFKIMVKGDLACSGTMIVEKSEQNL
jgi:3-hydroxyacyl-[acyl-carrier-protein] dehydratase